MILDLNFTNYANTMHEYKTKANISKRLYISVRKTKDLHSTLTYISLTYLITKLICSVAIQVFCVYLRVKIYKILSWKCLKESD